MVNGDLEGPQASSPGIGPRWDAQRCEANLKRTRARIERGRMQRRVLVPALAAAALLVLVGVWRTAAEPSTPEDRPQLLTGGTPLHFRDGSTARVLTATTRLEVRTATEERVEIVLEGGAAFSVVPNPARPFLVRVGQVSVRVLGTQFVVEEQGARVRVTVQEGSVQVAWPGSAAVLETGASGLYPPEKAATTASAAVAAVAAAPEPSASAAVPVRRFGSTERAVSPARSDREQFVAHIQRGEYQKAYAILADRKDVVGSSAQDLMRAADAARLSGHPGRAVPYLERITRDHAADSRAPLAAFTLGRIYLSQLAQPARAARAFAVTRRLAPGGPLASDALAREAEAALACGERSRAAALAFEYLERYPEGKRRQAMQRLGRQGTPR